MSNINQPSCVKEQLVSDAPDGKSDVMREKNIKQNPQQLEPHTYTRNDYIDILYCYIWAKKQAIFLHRGYTNLMLDKWNELRPDLHMSITALETKGKRIFDRSTNNPAPRNPWLTRSDLHEVEKKVLNDIRCVHPLNNEYEPEVPSGCTQPPSMNDDGHNSDLDPDYVCLLNRCVEIFDILKSQGILEQPRRPLRKKLIL